LPCENTITGYGPGATVAPSRASSAGMLHVSGALPGISWRPLSAELYVVSGRAAALAASAGYQSCTSTLRDSF
jgi:hypothetical protein